MGPQVQPKCFRHLKHMRNKWELRKRGYLIRFGLTEALLLKKYDIKRPFFPPRKNWPICNSKVGAMWGYSLAMFKHLIVRKCEKFHRLKHVCFFRPRYVSNYAGSTQWSITVLILKHKPQTISLFSFLWIISDYKSLLFLQMPSSEGSDNLALPVWKHQTVCINNWFSFPPIN